ncbi:XTP/dITP diphosphatase [Herbinix luporum]|jgi:XTP/dITP diphosphohydrolase|uniref:XTP/dITP diphosphatase n=1 Tax=Herbinix luporum TaxID=1679721 RepID=UPI0017539A5F|nr:XTP/dITP diphosphatase [Herbinix luporum]MDI9487784.1 XTP/dITP diphosphatase [Bacillota bacterium]HHT56943.1 XTP/dITP diphosphatase [Herbinix luporum]
MKKIIFATSNEGKLAEIKKILGDLKVEILSLKEANINVNIEENGTSFEENAIIKAKTICDLTGEIVFADDSGLEVDYLDKAPGIYSARFLGENTPYSVKNQYIIDKLKDVEENDRSARFVCVIACAFPDGNIITRTGVIEGYIAKKISGSNGFGYDPIFYVPEYNCTTADMPSELKNNISHRGKALQAMKEVLLKHI